MAAQRASFNYHIKSVNYALIISVFNAKNKRPFTREAPRTILWRQYLHCQDDTVEQQQQRATTRQATSSSDAIRWTPIHGTARKCSPNPKVNIILCTQQAHYLHSERITYLRSGGLCFWTCSLLSIAYSSSTRMKIKSPFNHYIFIFEPFFMHLHGTLRWPQDSSSYVSKNSKSWLLLPGDGRVSQ